MPAFSVVVPTYNRASRLERTLGSVLAQTFPDFELLVMDDGSTDDTQKVVTALCDKRIRYSWAANSGGPAAPRNRGLDVASADWVCFLDADDVWLPRKLEAVAEAISSFPTADAISHQEYIVLASGDRKRSSYGPFEPHFYRAMLLGGNRCSTSAMCVRRAFLNKHSLRFNTDPGFVIVEDYDLWLRMALFSARFVFLDEVLGEYLIDHDNISLDTGRMIANLETVLRDHVFNVQSFDSDKAGLWRAVSVRLSVARAKQLLAASETAAAWNEAWGSMLRSPAASAAYVASGLMRFLKRSLRK